VIAGVGSGGIINTWHPSGIPDTAMPSIKHQPSPPPSTLATCRRTEENGARNMQAFKVCREIHFISNLFLKITSGHSGVELNPFPLVFNAFGHKQGGLNPTPFVFDQF